MSDKQDVSPEEKKVEFRRELILLITGAAIALSSALITSLTQAHFQQAQAKADRQLKLLNEMSKSLGEHYATALLNQKMLRASLADIQATLDSGNFATNKQIDDLNRFNDASDAALRNLVNVLPGWEIQIKAVFPGAEEAPDDDSYVDLSKIDMLALKEIMELRRQVEATSDINRRISLLKIVCEKMDKPNAEAEKTLQDDLTKMYSRLTKLAHEVNK
ncbi:hypothetical protein SNE35_18810 [Paucibacter sp. R3-3]|uniref:Uncharacterized protein n=1 Tax=Roseateles agri TaxID=3098619 RepID=A0ABU5DJU7_9BURK|nr:hypothetical protein [Paucibacter sp. R3-3]MDY0746572.1 hypothetical protein [Paucibacter sp. R3-3]